MPMATPLLRARPTRQRTRAGAIQEVMATVMMLSITDSNMVNCEVKRDAKSAC